jgi:hypothetical protein
MQTLRVSLILLCAILVGGCYHASVSTGRTPSNVVIDRPFAASWIYGLVPPATVETASECANGVATVETQLSFVNQLVSFITFGIFTPMHVTVTCAAAGSASASAAERAFTIPERATHADVLERFGAAADEAVASEGAVYVRFE